MKNRKLGIIGGSGLYKMEGFEKPKWKKVDTPWGSPSDSVMIAKFYGNEICFIPRHSRGHKISPTNINFRANIDAMKQLGVTDVISVSAVVSLKKWINFSKINSGPLFRRFLKGSKLSQKRLTDQTVALIIKGYLTDVRNL